MRPRLQAIARISDRGAALLAAGLVSLLLFGTGPLRAETITPSHVYQVVETVQAELALLLEANFSATEVPAEQAIAGRRPRHVLQEANQISQQIRLLKRINGLPTAEAKAAEVREITPADVKASVDAILAEVRALRGPYGVTAEAPAVELRDGKTPTDVQAALAVTAQLVQRLDLPAIVPNDVYRLALAIKADATQIQTRLGAPEAQPILEGISGMKPPQVYARSFDLLERLKVLTESSAELAIPGGVVPPPKKSDNLKPADVLGVLKTILAELSSMKVVVGASEPTPALPPQVGKTPNDVYIAVEETLAIIEAVSTAAGTS